MSFLPVPLLNVPAINNNNNDIIWIPRERKNVWNFPKIGSYTITGGTVWDDTVSAYVPGAFGSFTFQRPFILTDIYQKGILTTKDVQHIKNGRYAFRAVSILVYPLFAVPTAGPGAGHNCWAFMMKPYGADTLITDYVDETKYLLQGRLVHRHGVVDKYSVWPIKQHNAQKESLIQFFNEKTGEAHLWKPNKKIFDLSIDSDAVFTAISISRRDKTSFARSPWVKVFQVRRRTPNAPAKIDPCFSR